MCSSTLGGYDGILLGRIPQGDRSNLEIPGEILRYSRLQFLERFPVAGQVFVPVFQSSKIV